MQLVDASAERPAPAEDVPGSGGRKQPSWGAGAAGFGANSVPGGTAWPRGRWAPAKRAGNPPEQARGRRAGRTAHRWELPVNL